MQNIIFTDFDGVLFDSVKEAYLLARYAYYNIPIKDKIDEKHIKVSKTDKFENLYNKLLNQDISTNIRNFDKKYVQAREALIKDDYEFWDSLDIPFKFFYQIKELAENKEYKFIILTNKKRLPVKNKLEKYNAKNFELYANEELQQFKNKAEFINYYLKKYNIQKCYLIEDSIDNINNCKKYPQIQCLLANWGYINPKETGLSKEEIINYIKEQR